MAMYLAVRGLIHCLATDSHDAKSRNAAQVRLAAARVEEFIGQRNLRLISRENPIRVLRNEPLMSMEKSERTACVKKVRRFRRLSQIIKGKINHRDPQITQISAD
jgi:tyrosine-protein phosphatase YwqE